MKLHFTSDWLLRRIASDPDADFEAGEPLEGRTQMSWSFAVIGRPEAVAKAAIAAMEKNPCAQPEEAYRLDALAYITKAASQLIGATAVQVTASGSMWKDGDTVKSHTLSLEFKPLYGFVE